jgi:hypothetical protein
MARRIGVLVSMSVAFVALSAGQASAQTPPPASPPPAGYPPAAGSPPPDGYAPAPAYGAAPGYPAPAPGIVYAPPAPPKENSINGNPMGALFGNYSLNYERLFSGTHGLMVEGTLSFSSGTSTSGTEASASKSTLYGGAVGYRWHWSGQQQSGFLGLMAGYTVGSGSSTITSGGMSSNFDLTIKAPWVVGNIGKRWVWDSGINVTFRIGAGWAKYSVSSSSTDPQAQDAVKFLQDVLTLIPIALDGELSLGYTF